MLILSVLMVSVGLGLVAYGIANQRLVAVARPDSRDVVLGYADDVDDDGPDLGVSYRVLEPLLDAGGRFLRRLSPVRRLELTRQRIVYAGLEGTLTVERMLSYKAAAFAGGLLFALPGGPAAVPRPLWMLGLATAASFVPDVLLSSRAEKRQTEIGRSLPEALDLLALTVEAGLGFEQALAVVVENTTGPFCAELTRLQAEIELGVSRRDALAALRERTDVPELSSFVVALVQSDQMGIALGDLLKAQAAQVRLKRRQKAKEQAAKTPVKILFPVVIGIFPALFIVTIGPGALSIMRTML